MQPVLNPHPDDVLTDTELQDIAREYLEKLGYGNQPYLVVKHEDIDRHHLHIVTINVDEKGRRLNQDFLFRRSDRIRRELERKYGLHPAERKNLRLENPLRKVDASAGDGSTGFSTLVCSGIQARKPSIALRMSTVPVPSL